MAGHPDITTRPTWIGGKSRLARGVAQPVARFLSIEAAGGILLLLATGVALIWANSPWHGSYEDLLHTEFVLGIGGWEFTEHGHPWTFELLVNDALMAVFFFVVGLEIKQELVVGELSDPRAASLPAVAALGGMVVPAGIYLMLNSSGSGSAGWGIPMATDIAFAVGVVALLGKRVPSSLKIFLLTLAIVDDIGAIAVIAIFYSEGISFGWLAAAIVLMVVAAVMKRARVWYIPAYVIVGVVIWFATFQSGVHATIAGVAMGLLCPARPLHRQARTAEVIDKLERSSTLNANAIREAYFDLKESVSVAERLETLLHPWTSYVVIPVFALANAGLVITADGLSDAASSTVTLGVVLGLVVGKTIGVAGATWIAARLGLAPLPVGVRVLHLAGIGMIAGIGFTVAIFVGGLAFEDPTLADQSLLGILIASVIAAICGSVMLTAAGNNTIEVPAEEYDEMVDTGDLVPSGGD
ncbi:MAG: Na+/H+ antiporter NhaA [Actinomycetia bacterium]|nr:Na+/H+ antiporter NhaA [Actinomycetes bacterium]MCP3913657.1 Na+/H+ antiporter NhaA [Actinomycetes bacterium]MCP4086845.1 Na+/H+ antiporter NhaA [Actinomycetes bacterium]